MGRSAAMDLTVSASTLAARLTVSKSCSLVKLKRNMLSACRYMLSLIVSGWLVTKVVNTPKCLMRVTMSSQ